MANKEIPKDFDWREYLRLNTDVSKKVSNEEGALLHWTEFGCNEGRLYKSENRPLECIITRKEETPVFLSVKKMVLEKYSSLKEYNNCLVLLGYNMLCDLDNIKKEYPSRKIIIYQLEQLCDNQSTWYNENSSNPAIVKRTTNIKKCLSQCDEIWDYDLDNIRFLKDEGFKHIVHKPMIYVDSLKKEAKNISPKYDILFYGSINEKRAKYLRMIADNFNICILTNMHDAQTYKSENFSKFIKNEAYGDELMDYVFNSKIVLNLHYYESKIQEQVRIFELLINNKLVVSEKSKRNYYGDSIVEFEDEKDMFDKIKQALKKWNKVECSQTFNKDITTKNINNFKIGAVYNSFYGLDLIETSINSIKDIVDYIVVVHQREGFKGEKEPSINKYVIDYLLKNGIINDIVYVDDYSKKNINDFILHKRNIGLEYCKKNGCDYIIPMDNDEIYESSELKLEIKYMNDNDIDTLYCKIKSYYYDDCHFFYDTYYVPSVYKIDDRKFESNGKSSYLVDSLRKMNEKKYRLSDACMHHYTYLKGTFSNKIQNSVSTINNKGIYNSMLKIFNELMLWEEGKRALVFTNDSETGTVDLQYIKLLKK